jgi:hypothetical protein
VEATYVPGEWQLKAWKIVELSMEHSTVRKKARKRRASEGVRQSSCCMTTPASTRKITNPLKCVHTFQDSARTWIRFDFL